MRNFSVPASEAKRDIIMSILLTFFTCGIYDIYWNAKQMKTFNALLARDEFSVSTWLFGTFITCGLFHIFYEYKMGTALVEIQKRMQIQVDENLPLISLILTLCGLSLVVDAIHQNEINKIYNLP